MTRSTLRILPIILGIYAVSTAQAQVMMDVSKISCDQFVAYKITDPDYIAMWLSGYYNGKRGNTMIDVQALKDNIRKIKDYCIVHPEVTVMQAVETLFGLPNR